MKIDFWPPKFWSRALKCNFLIKTVVNRIINHIVKTYLCLSRFGFVCIRLSNPARRINRESVEDGVASHYFKLLLIHNFTRNSFSCSPIVQITKYILQLIAILFTKTERKTVFGIIFGGKSHTRCLLK